MTDKPKIIFAPGALEMMEQTMAPEELQSVMDELKALVESGELLEQSREVDMDDLEKTDPELHALLVRQLEGIEDIDPPTLN